MALSGKHGFLVNLTFPRFPVFPCKVGPAFGGPPIQTATTLNNPPLCCCATHPQKRRVKLFHIFSPSSFHPLTLPSLKPPPPPNKVPRLNFRVKDIRSRIRPLVCLVFSKCKARFFPLPLPAYWMLRPVLPHFFSILSVNFPQIRIASTF